MLVALARGVEVGVDVEDPARDVSGWALWPHVLSPTEVARLPRAQYDRNAEVLRLWVAKEAILKAAGSGLAVDPRSVELDAHGRVAALPAALGDPGTWSVVWLQGEGVVAAVACAMPDLRIDIGRSTHHHGVTACPERGGTLDSSHALRVVTESRLMSRVEATPASPSVRSKSARRLRITSRTPSSPPAASPHT